MEYFNRHYAYSEILPKNTAKYGPNFYITSITRNKQLGYNKVSDESCHFRELPEMSFPITIEKIMLAL